MCVYEEGNYLYGKENYPKKPNNIQLLYAEQDFYQFLLDFFTEQKAKYFVWIVDGYYVSALRVQIYKDGYILTALETMPCMRGKGYATCLLKAVIAYLSLNNCHKLYSHVSKNNEPSLAVHSSCGFQVVIDSAEYIDGSVHNDSYTLLAQY